MNKTYIGIGLSLILLISIYFLFSSDNATKKEENKKIEQKEKKEEKIKTNKQEKKIKKERKQKKEKIKQKSIKKEIKKNIYYEDAFEEKEIEDIQESFPRKPNIEPLSGFSYKKGTIKKLTVGDTIDIPSINGENYSLKIEKRIENEDGSVSLKASIDDEDEKYFAVLTEGKNMSFITIFSPEGNHEIETKGNDGYLYDSKTVKRSWINYNKTDGIKVTKKK